MFFLSLRLLYIRPEINTNMNTLILIPARYASTRFPGKPVAVLGDKTVIQHVVEAAEKFTEYTYVATDDSAIFDRVLSFGGKAIMTSEFHRSGTDRCREAMRKVVRNYGEKYFDVVVNLQGDEPFANPEDIARLADSFSDSNVDIATLAKRFDRTEDVTDPNKVKVVTDMGGNALYFSRSPIPYFRGKEKADWLESADYYKHIGMYAYRPHILEAIADLPAGKLETVESLEQLRWLENGYRIAVRYTEHESVGIDSPEDLIRAEKILKMN